MPSRIQRNLASLVLVLTGLMVSACGEEKEPPPASTNTPPTLTGPTASVGQVSPGGAITLTLAATDPDGDTLSYAWAQTPASPAGTFSSTTAASPTWTAPAVTGTQDFTLAVTVTDGKGGSKQGSINVTVAEDGQANRPPSVDAITAPSTLVAGTTGDFSIRASDPDGDPLTYTWEQTAPATPGAWVGATSGTSAQWYSPPVGAQTSFTLKVSVTDGRNAPVVQTGTVSVTVPKYGMDIQPVWSMGMCTDCHFGAGGSLNLKDGSSHASLVNVPTVKTLCRTLNRVTPNEPDISSLVRKMEGPACGDRMPRGDETYFDNNPGLLVRVRSWILAGAKDD